MPRLSVPLTADQHAAIRRKAGALGVPQAEVARRLLLAWARGEIIMPQYVENEIAEDEVTRRIREAYGR